MLTIFEQVKIQLETEGYTVEGKIGAGFFGSVHITTLLASHGAADTSKGARQHCVKIAKVPDKSREPVALAAMRREAEILNLIGSHKNIIPLIKVIYSTYTTTPIAYIMPLHTKDLFSRIEGSAQLTDDNIMQIHNGILTGINHLHDKKILHRDLKPENIVIGPDDTAIIIDFGYAVHIDDSIRLREIVELQDYGHPLITTITKSKSCGAEYASKDKATLFNIGAIFDIYAVYYIKFAMEEKTAARGCIKKNRHPFLFNEIQRYKTKDPSKHLQQLETLDRTEMYEGNYNPEHESKARGCVVM